MLDSNGNYVQKNPNGTTTTYYSGTPSGVGGLLVVTKDAQGNVVANPSDPSATTPAQVSTINYLNKTNPGNNYRTEVVKANDGSSHTVIVSGAGGAGNVFAGDPSGISWANSNGLGGIPISAAGNTTSNGGPVDPTTGASTWTVNTGTNGGVSTLGNIVGKTLIPAGEAIGALPTGSTADAKNIQLAADLARSKGLTSIPVGGAPITSGGTGITFPGSTGGAAPVTTPNSGPLADAIKKAQDQADAAGNAAKNYVPISAPTITAAQMPAFQAAGYAPAAQAGVATAGQSQGYAAQAGQVGAYQAAGYTAPIQAGHATAGVAQASLIGSTTLAQKQAAIQAERVQAALIAQQPAIQAQQVQAAQADRTIVGPTALADQSQIAPVDLAGNTTIDQSESEQSRAAQLGLISQLQGTIAGTSPSVAAIMLRQETERNIANQFGMAAAASAQNVGLANRQAMNNAASLNQQSIGQQALLRAQEIATAQGLLGTTAGSARTSDINVATSQADLSQQVILANAGFTNTQNMTQAQLDQAVKLANAGFKNTATTTQAQLDQATKALNVTQANSVNLANAKNALDAATTNVTLAQQALLANQSAQNQAALANAQNALAAATTNAQLAQQVELTNANAVNHTNEVNATLATNTSVSNAGFATQASITNANNTTSANTATAQLANAISIANANNQSQMQVAQAGYTTQAGIATASNYTNSSIGNARNQTDASQTNATNATNASINTSTLANAVNIANSGNSTQYNIAQGGFNNSAAINNAANAVTTAGQNITAQQNAAGNAITSEGQVIQGQVGMANAANGAVSAAAAQQQAANGDPSNPYNWIPKVASDRRGKKEIKDADLDVKKLVASLGAKSFRYKDTSAPGTAPGRRWGVMAQDLEKSKAGKSLVTNTPTGKMVDTSQAVMTALAALGHVAKRLDKVEKRVSR
jgi:hypothetical protein